MKMFPLFYSSIFGDHSRGTSAENVGVRSSTSKRFGGAYFQLTMEWKI
jgi:hypothetical protein